LISEYRLNAVDIKSVRC